MSQATIFNGLGTAFLFVGLILHIICMATPYYSNADMSSFGKELAAKTPEELGFKGHLSQETIEEVKEEFGAIGDGSFNYGLWKVCLHYDGGSDDEKLDMCVKWGKDTEFNVATGSIKSYKAESWVRAVQAMSIIALIPLSLAAAGAVVNVAIKSKGDRMRLMYLIIVFLCFFAALFIFIGDIIMAAKHERIFDALITTEKNPPPEEMYDLFQEMISLSWGFALDVVSGAFVLLSGVAHFIGGRIMNTFSGVV